MTPAPGAFLRCLATVHLLAQGGLVVFGLHRLWMLRHWFAQRRRVGEEQRLRREEEVRRGAARLARARSAEACGPVALPADRLPVEACPRVTVQLPLYNERFVAARLIDAAARIEWPPDRLEIQVLDDSTDDTGPIVDERAAYWAGQGITVRVQRRSGRAGYKAGALAEGLAQAAGEFVAIFDADFLPPADFLRRTMNSFADPGVGMVQARWGFVNAEHSWLTRVQALLLGAHFGIEHQVRYSRGLFFNFNGTAGTWRRRAIEEAGGWQADTVTEDLDLSYRAQLAGWRFVYLDELVVPSELPVTLGAFRAQQQRWAKGSIQAARKLLSRVLRADLPRPVKAEAVAHLLGNLGWLLLAVLLATLYPAALCRVGRGMWDLAAVDLPLLLASSGAFLAYFTCEGAVRGGGRALWPVLLLPVVSVGMSPTISAGVLAGLFARGGTFERTPKYGIRGRDRMPRRAFLYHRRANPYLAVNTLLFLYSCLPLAFAVGRGTWAALPFLCLFPAGFATYVAQDLREWVGLRPGRAGPVTRPASPAGNAVPAGRAMPARTQTPASGA